MRQTVTQERSYLGRLADDMRLALLAQEQAYLHRPLQRGLHVVLQRQGESWRLALGRKDVYPSEQEAAICCRAFRAPEGTEVVKVEQRRRGFWVLECRWVEY